MKPLLSYIITEYTEGEKGVRNLKKMSWKSYILK